MLVSTALDPDMIQALEDTAGEKSQSFYNPTDMSHCSTVSPTVRQSHSLGCIKEEISILFKRPRQYIKRNQFVDPYRINTERWAKEKPRIAARKSCFKSAFAAGLIGSYLNNNSLRLDWPPDELYLPPMRKIDSILSEQKRRLLRRVSMSSQHQVICPACPASPFLPLTIAVFLFLFFLCPHLNVKFLIAS